MEIGRTCVPGRGLQSTSREVGSTLRARWRHAPLASEAGSDSRDVNCQLTRSITKLGRVEKWEAALAQFDSAQRSAVELDVVSFGAAVNVCGVTTQWQRAVSRLVEQIGKAFVQPNISERKSRSRIARERIACPRHDIRLLMS